MDFEEMNTELQTVLESNQQALSSQIQQLQQTISNLQNSQNPTSDNGKMKEFVYEMQENLQKSNAENLRKIADELNAKTQNLTSQIRRVMGDEVSSIVRTVRNEFDETSKFAKEQRRNFFTNLLNVAVCILIGGVLVFAGTMFKYYKDERVFAEKALADEKAKIEKEAVNAYINALVKEPMPIQILELEKANTKYNKDRWQDPNARMERIDERIKDLKKYIKGN